MRKFIFWLIAAVLVLVPASYAIDGNAKVMFAGDMFFDRYIRQVAQNKGGDFIFSCIGDFLKVSDLVVGNLEGPITDNSSVSQGTEIGSPLNYVFTFPPETAELLSKYNIKLVNLGNNHINNFGKTGITSTKEYLEKAGVNFIGGIAGDEPIYRTRLGGTNVSFVSFNEFGGDSAKEVVQKIKNEVLDNRMVIVYAHWGDEYISAPIRVKNIATLFAQNGASLIVGSHPHIYLPKETIGETLVYYSLGNFIFDQYWNESVSTGLLLEVEIKDGRIELTEHKVVINRDGRTCLEKS
jgi:poly-gamma-glutamate synthesis protein (capsule biosynthesis protein)